MISKDKKELHRALKNGTIQDIKYIFGKSNQPLEEKDVVKVLRLLLGRSNFDFEMVQLLKKHQCDLNAPLGDAKVNPDQYRMGDYLAAYGRLSPRLIEEMAKAGYDFSKTNTRGEHAGFYLMASSPINNKVVAALKAKGVDFSKPNNQGKTAPEMMVQHIYNLASRMLFKEPTKAVIQRLVPLFDRQKDMLDLVQFERENLKTFIENRIQTIEPKGYERVGIHQIRIDNKACQNLAYYAKKALPEHKALLTTLQQSFVSKCTPLALKKLGLKQTQKVNEA